VSTGLRRRIGFELELLAPRGASRLTLAEELAGRCAGRVRSVWHQDSEPSLVPGLGRFLTLTRGFEVRRGTGEPLCTLVDDVTLVTDLDPRAAPAAGWYRLLTDDPRLLRLLADRSDPAAAPEHALDGVAALWGEAVQRHGQVLRLDDRAGSTVALAAPHGGERERACEVVTPPLSTGHGAALEELLSAAGALGFTVPAEAAVHLHLDAAPFRSAPALANLVRLFGHWRPQLHALLGTNPACRRLGPLPVELLAATDGTPTFEQLRHAAGLGGLTKFVDLNLTQLFSPRPVRDTVEVRILPGTIDTADVLRRAALVERLLDRCLDPQPVPHHPADAVAAMDHLLEMTVLPMHHVPDPRGRLVGPGPCPPPR
jgi:hypothetical protein